MGFKSIKIWVFARGILVRFWNWECLQHEPSGRTWYVTVWSPGRWGDQVRAKRQALYKPSQSFYCEELFFKGTSEKKKKFQMECWEQPFDYWDLLLRAYCTKKSLLALMNNIMRKVTEPYLCMGENHVLKKPSFLSLKQAKGKLLLTSTYILIVNGWLL